MKLKRVHKVIIVVVSIILSFAISLCVGVMLFNYNHLWKHSADFDSYSTDFNTIKDYAADSFSSDYGKWVAVSITDEEGRTLYDPDMNDNMDIPEEIRSSLEVICDYGFPNKDSVLDVIRIHGNRVAFYIENGRYALVYSPDETPTWINSPDEDRDVKVKKIGDGWFHVTEDS